MTPADQPASCTLTGDSEGEWDERDMSVGEMGEAELPYSQGSEGEVYSIEEIDSFLTTKNMKNVELSENFPDAQKFLRSVRQVLGGPRVPLDRGVTPKRKFRLIKWATEVRRNLSSLE